MPEDNLSTTMQILEFISDEDLHSSIYWRTDGKYGPVTFFITSSDLLAWGGTDCEEVNEETLPLLKQAVEECKAIDPVCGAIAGCDLFICRANKSRPQGAAYPDERELWPLFNACGPERRTGVGNPYTPGERKTPPGGSHGFLQEFKTWLVKERHKTEGRIILPWNFIRKAKLAAYRSCLIKVWQIEERTEA